MTKSIPKTGERIIPKKFESREEYLVYLRHLFAYKFAQSNISQDSFVLDLGCGEGYGTRLLSGNVKEIVGLDTDLKTIHCAAQKYGGRNCIFKTYNGVNIPYEDNTFDNVVSFQVIEHVKNDVNYISEIHRVLETDGIFMLSTPNKTLRLKPGQNPWNRFHIREYYPAELLNILKNKFSDVRIWGIKGNEDIQQIEKDRVDKNLRIIAMDPFSFRNIIPEKLKPTVIKIAKKIMSRNKKNTDFIKKYQVTDFFMVKNKVEESLDIFGICRK